MAEKERCCENCGNTRCANSLIVYNWDECVETKFQKNWRPLPEKKEGEPTCH